MSIQDLNKLMNMLATKKISKELNPKLIYGAVFWITSYRCRICNYSFGKMEYDNWLFSALGSTEIYDHAMEHVKESNLLPFL